MRPLFVVLFARRATVHYRSLWVLCQEQEIRPGRSSTEARRGGRDNGCLSSRACFAAHASFLGAGPRAQALQALQKAIDNVSFVVTGECEYFYPVSSRIA